MTLESRIMAMFSTGHVCANIYVPAWWECDVVRVTKANRWDEVEIKTSVSDFKADARKSRMVRRDGLQVEQFKHELLAAGDVNGPNRFWFAMPEDIADKVQIPEWAGLMVWGKVQKKHWPFSCSEKRQPKLLHPENNGGNVRGHLYDSIYHRWANHREFFPFDMCMDGAGI